MRPMILLTAPLICLLVGAQTAVAGDEIARGRKQYMDHCAACHGIKGDGHGPLEHELAKPPADLRLLFHRYGNPLPEDQIARFLDGRADIAAHGPRDMPVWGEEMWQFSEGHGNPNQVTDTIRVLIRYLQSIQISTHHTSLEQRAPQISAHDAVSRVSESAEAD